MSAPLPSDSLCVFCGSSPGTDPIYTSVAEQVGQAIASHQWRLVYGGGQRGIMGSVAQSTLSSGGHVLGVIPQVMTSSAPSSHPTSANGSKEGSGPTSEVAQHDRMETRVVSSMHERKQIMAKESQRGFAGLPGGYGTFEEVLEMVTWSQLGIHNLPIVLPNVNNFWSPLQMLVKQAAETGFITPAGLDLIYFLDPQEVQEQYSGSWGEAVIASVEKMQEKLKGRAGYWDWNAAASSAAKHQDFSGQETAIKVDKLNYTFQNHSEPSLIDINLSLPQGSRTLLIGANGAGKSTLLRLLAGKRLVSTSKDHTPVKIFDKDVFNSPPSGITYLGTEWAMNPVVRSDIRVEDFLNSVGGFRYKSRRDELLDLLDVDLEWHMHAISDGERRRVQLCMGLMMPWKVLLLDEVTVDLDVQVRSDLLDFLKKETLTRNATIVYATHIFDGLHDFPTHIAHMRLGQIVHEDDHLESGGALLWPPADADSNLLDVTLGWLRADRVLRSEYEAQRGQFRGSKKSINPNDTTDSEKFFAKYDYSQTVTR
ncbi:unnamed protein product [Sympodiomycopsis kandeliae]